MSEGVVPGMPAGCDAVIAGDEWSADHEVRVQVAETLVGKGNALVRLGRYDEAVECYDRVVERFGEADEGDLRRLVHRSLSKKGSAFARLGRLDEADAAYDALCARLSNVRNPKLALLRVQALRASALFDAGRHEQAIVAADALLEQFADSPPPTCLDLVVKTLSLKAYALSDLGREQEAIGPPPFSWTRVDLMEFM